MDLAQERLHLDEVERNIAMTQFRLVRQRQLVERAEARGNFTADQLQMVTAMEKSLEALRTLKCAVRVTVARLEREW